MSKKRGGRRRAGRGFDDERRPRSVHALWVLSPSLCFSFAGFYFFFRKIKFENPSHAHNAEESTPLHTARPRSTRRACGLPNAKYSTHSQTFHVDNSGKI